MKKIMNKICIILAAVFLLLGLSACSRQGICEDCGQYEKLNKYVKRSGDVMYLCDDCYRMAKFIGY